MSRTRLSEALDACLRAVRAGASLDEAVESYPDLRHELRPLLEAALRLRPVSLEMAEEAKLYYRNRMMAEIRGSRRPAVSQPSRRFSWPRLLLVPTLAGAIVGALLLGLNTTQAPDSAEAATMLTVLEGRVFVETTAGLVAAENGMRLAPGTRVVTQGDGRAVLTFVDGSTVTLGGDTDVAIRSVLEREGRVTVKLAQSRGQTWTYIVSHFGQAEIEIDTPHGKVQTLNASFVTVIEPDGRTYVRAQSGAVQLLSGEQRSNVRSGEHVVIHAPGVLDAFAAEPSPELIVRVSGAVHVYLTDPSGGTVGTLAPGIPVSQVTGATAEREGNGVLIRVPAPREGAYRIVLRSTGSGRIEIAASITDLGRDSLTLSVNPNEDWGIGLLYRNGLLGFGEAARLDTPHQPNVVVTDKLIEKAATAGAAATAASPVRTPTGVTPTATATATPAVSTAATATPPAVGSPIGSATPEPTPVR
jgi:hypothetical protein